MHVFVVIPGFNEKLYIGRVLQKVQKITQDVVYVDDGSSDGSAKDARKYIPHVLQHEINLGKGAAMKTGCEYAFSILRADAVIFLDADDQHDAQEIPKFYKALEHSDVVFGVRNMGASMPLSRFLGNKMASVFMNLLYGTYIPDIPSGYKALTRQAYSKLKWESSGYEVEMEIAMKVARYKLPFAIVEVESIYHDLDKGMTLLDALYITVRLVAWRLGL